MSDEPREQPGPEDGLPPALLARHPELRAVGEALQAHKEGRPITARCPHCGNTLAWQAIQPLNEYWITCPVGCTRFHARKGD